MTYPHEFNFTEPLLPLRHGRKMFVPGPGDEAVDATGKIARQGTIRPTAEGVLRPQGMGRRNGTAAPGDPQGAGIG